MGGLDRTERCGFKISPEEDLDGRSVELCGGGGELVVGGEVDGSLVVGVVFGVLGGLVWVAKGWVVGVVVGVVELAFFVEEGFECFGGGCFEWG